MITHSASGTNLHEVAPDIYRINTPVTIPGGAAFNFNRYLVVDDEPLIFHTGPKGMFALTAEAIAKVMPVARLRHIAFSHFEADECGALNDFLAAAPDSAPVCSRIGAMVAIDDFALRPAHALVDGQTLQTGRHAFAWFDAPHVPHGWDCGFMLDRASGTLFCGDLYTQDGPGTTPLTRSDILAPSEAFRRSMDYYAHAPNTAETIERLASEAPGLLACMHGSAWEGDCAALLRALARSLAGDLPR